MKKFYVISILLIIAGISFVLYQGDLAPLDQNFLTETKFESKKPLMPDRAPIKRKNLKIITEKDVKNVKLVNVKNIPPRSQLIIKSIKRGSNTLIRSKNRQDEVFVLKEINALSPSFQTTLGTNYKNKQESNQRLFIGSSATKHSAPATKIAMAFYNSAISGIISRPDGSSTYIQSDAKTGKIFSYTPKPTELDCSESKNSDGEVTYTMAPVDENIENLKLKGEEIEILAAENTESAGTTYNEEEAGEPTGINPPEYDKSLININWLIWVDKASTNIRVKEDGDTKYAETGDLILTLEEHASLQLAKVAMMNALYQNQLGIKFTLQEIILIPESDPQNDPVYTSDETDTLVDETQPQYCLLPGARCGPIGAAKHLMERYRPIEIYHWDQVPYQMRKKVGDTYKWGGLAGCCAGTTSGVFVNNFATSGLGGAVPHETGHNVGISHLMGGGVMGGSAIDGRSFFSFVREGSLKGIKFGSTQAFDKMSPKSWFTSLHPKYTQMRNPREIPWAVGDNYQLNVTSDASSREVTVSPMDNDLLFTPEGNWNESMDIPEIGPIYPPNAGVLKLEADNKVKFVANEGFYGPAKFRYTLRGHLPAYLQDIPEPQCLHADKHNSKYSKIAIEDCNITTETPEDKDYNFNIPFFPVESPIFKIKNNGGCLRPYSGSEDISTYGLKNFADVFFVGACTGEANWDQWIFEPVNIGFPDAYRIKNKFTGFCLNSMKNIQSECNDVNNYWQVKVKPDPNPQEKCLTGNKNVYQTVGISLRPCGDFDPGNKENQDWYIDDINNPANEIRKGNSGGYYIFLDSKDNTVDQEGLSIKLVCCGSKDQYYSNKWTFSPVAGADKYKIQNDFSGLCLSRSLNQKDCSYKETTWKITQLPSGKYEIASVPDGDWDTTYQLVSIRQPREGWLHAGDVTIDIVQDSGAPDTNIDLTQNLQVTIPMNSFYFWGKDADIEEFYFNPLIDLTLMPQTLDPDGKPYSIYRNPIQMDITLGTTGSKQIIERNAISINSVSNFDQTLADYRIIKDIFTVDGVSQPIANGYLAVKLKRDPVNYRPDHIVFNIEVVDQKGEIQLATVSLIPPIARINLDRIELPVNETLNLITDNLASSPSITWRKIFGPGTFVATGNNGSFSAPGKYLLRMTAIKNGLSTFQEVDINVLTESGEKIIAEAPPGPGEAPITNKIVIGKDGTEYLIAPDGEVNKKDPGAIVGNPLPEGFKHISLVNSSNYSYINRDGFIFITKGGNEVNTGVKGSHVSMGVDGTIIAILDDLECTTRGKSPGCLYQYYQNSWQYWGYQKFTGKNSTHQTIEEMRDVFARDIHVLSADHIAIVDRDGALFEMSEHVDRGKEFWELGGVWRKVKISIHGRIVGIGEDNTLKKWVNESWFPLKPNVGDFEFEHNGRITSVDFDNNIERIPEFYFSSPYKIDDYWGNNNADALSLGQDGTGHFMRYWNETNTSVKWFDKNIKKISMADSNRFDNQDINVAESDKICAAKNNSSGLRIFGANELGEYPSTIGSYQKNIVCAADGTTMSIITDANAVTADIPKGSALQLINGNWFPVGGRLMQLDVGSEHLIYGVDFQNRAWRKEGKKWKRIPGLIKQIAVGPDGTLASIGTDDYIYIMIDKNWVNLEIKAKKISASVNNQIVYIGMDDMVYANYPNFFPIPIIHETRRSILRPRKGVAFRALSDYRLIHGFGSGVSIWEAINLPTDYVNLGHIVHDSHTAPTYETRGYQEREVVMEPPVAYEELTVLDAGNGLKVYRPIPEAGYSCLGHLAWEPADTGLTEPPLDLIRCIESSYIETAILDHQGENMFKVIPANERAQTKNYFQFWEDSEDATPATTFYIPLPKDKAFSLFPKAFAQDPPPPADPDEVEVGAVLVGEEFLTTEENLATLDAELEELADEELEEEIEVVPPPSFPPPGTHSPGSPSPGSPEGAAPPGGVIGGIYQGTCASTERVGANSSLFFFGNFLLGFLLTLFRRRK